MSTRGWLLRRAIAFGLSLGAMAPATVDALQMFPAAEVQEAHALRQRILAAIPPLDPRELRQRPPLPPETLGLAQQRLTELQPREAENPFFHWAQGEVLRQTQGPAAASPAFGRARQAAGQRMLIHWLLWQDFLARDLREEAEREEQALQAIQVMWGLSRFPLLARELMRQGNEAAESGDLARAVALYDAAIANAPELPEALVGRATLRWQVDKLRLIQTGRDLARGLYYTLGGVQTGFRLTRNLLLSLLIAWLSALCLVAIILAIKTQPLFAHDLNERLLRSLPGPVQFHLGLLLFVLPLLLGLGVLWWVAFSFLVLAPYMSRRERRVVLVLLALLVTLPLGYERVAAGHVLAASNRFALIQAAAQGGRGEGLVRELRRFTQEAPDSGLAHYSLGLVLKRRGELPEAEVEMAQAARLLPTAGFVQVGRGNVEQLRGRPADAEASYRRAAELQPSAAAQMNLATLYTRRLQLDRSDEALAKSLKLDPHMVRTVSHFHGQGMTEILVDEPVPWDAVAAGLAPRPEEVRAVAEGLWGRPLRGVGLRGLPYAVVALLVLIWSYVLMRGRTPPVRRCRQCGAPFCARCQFDPREKDYCTPCAAVFRDGEGVAAVVKVRRMREGEEWVREERARAGLLGSIVPGGNDVYRGHILRGLCFTVPVIWLLLEGFILDALTPSFRFASPLPGPVRWTTALLILVILYAVSIQRSWRKPTAEPL